MSKGQKISIFKSGFVRHLSCVFILFVFSLSGYAQVYESEELLLKEFQDEILVQEKVNNGSDQSTNKAHVLQVGYFNQSSISQESSGSFSRPNVGLVFQQGAHNEVFILQAGSGNSSSSSQQGYGNDYELYLLGDNNSTNVIQQGVDNNVEQYISGDGVDYTVIQQGAHNELIQVENNPEMPAYTVYQRGVGISIVIENYSVY